MSRSYRGVLDKSLSSLGDIFDNIYVDINKAYEIIKDIKDEDVSDATVGKLGEVECILDNLIDEIK